MSLQGWDDTKKLKIIIDNDKIDGDLTDFPILLSLSDSVGTNNFDASCVFDEVSTHPYEVCDDFTGANGSTPDVNLWRISSSSDVDIYNNKLRFADNNNYSSVTSEFVLSGDFNIQVDFDITNGPSSDGWAISLIVYINEYGYIMVRRRYSGGHSYYMEDWNGGVGSSVGSTDTSGKLCIVRAGNIFSGYFWHNAGYWYKLGSKTYDMVQNDIKYIRFLHNSWGGSPPSFGFNFDNFKVNNGTPYYPSRLAITATVSGVETQCYSEIERWEQENNKAILWTKVPTVASGSDTELSLYYDKSHLSNWDYIDFVGTTAGKAVWDSNFVGVWHMGQDPTGGSNCIKDSTSSANHGTPGGSMTSTDLVDGQVGKALDFDGSNDTIGLDSTKAYVSGSFTVESLINLTVRVAAASVPVVGNIQSNSPWRHNYLLRELASDNKIEIIFRGNDDTLYHAKEGAALSLNTWYNYHAVFKSSTKLLSLYKNGSFENSTTATNWASFDSTNLSAIIGGTPAETINGTIDEVRISNTARSADWIKATYYSNWDDLITYEQQKYYFAGYTLVEDMAPVSRVVRVYSSSNGRLVGETTSSGTTGYYQVWVNDGNNHYLVCMDAEALPDYNNIIVSKAIPYEV